MNVITALSVTDFTVDFIVAGMAKRHQVWCAMVASAGYGKNVMDFLCGSGSAFGQTFFAQRVRGNITVTDAFPCASVFFIDVGRTPVFVVLLFRRCPVFLTVLSVTQIRTAWERTRLLWFCRQGSVSFRV